MEEKAARKRILVVYAHPKEDSLNRALRDALVGGLEDGGAEVRIEDLYARGFDPVLRDREENARNPETLAMQEDLAWAEWLVVVAPMWWVGQPAILKGYFDRVFTEGFSFRYLPSGMPEGLLPGKKALLLSTCDTPGLILRLARRRGGYTAFLSGVIRFSGFERARYMLFGPVITSTPKKRQAWLQSARRMGSRIATPESRSAAAARRVRSFVAAMRLQMYSFVLFPLLLGSALGAAAAGHFNWQAFAVAAVLGLAAHTAVSFSNQVTDERIDGGNLNRSMFNGGTALLARGRLSRRDLQGGWIAASVLAVAGAALIVTLFGRHWLVLVAGTSGLILGLQYSLAPLRLSRLGLGELAALLAYGVPLLLSGALLQVREASAGSVLTDPRLYLFSLTSVLPIFATLCLTQIPDTEADGRNGKRSVSVLLGPRAVLACTGALLLATGGLLLGFATARLLPPVNAAVAGGIPAAAGLVLLLNRAALKVPAGPRMLNLMGLSVTAAVAASLVPAIHFLQVAGQAAR